MIHSHESPTVINDEEFLYGEDYRVRHPEPHHATIFERAQRGAEHLVWHPLERKRAVMAVAAGALAASTLLHKRPHVH